MTTPRPVPDEVVDALCDNSPLYSDPGTPEERAGRFAVMQRQSLARELRACRVLLRLWVKREQEMAPAFGFAKDVNFIAQTRALLPEHVSEGA